MNDIIEIEVPQSPRSRTPEEFDAYVREYDSKINALDAKNKSDGLTHRVDIMFDGYGEASGRQVTFWETDATEDGVETFIDQYIKSNRTLIMK